ncbi:LysR family transcriptional regulator [Lentzea flaviverrucosa]|uniref:DNA-binding transcriptional regulator, LysR family n=1 Tax=Lentzea flaviverrucosa TaxID=200379 RepID=A0A1H9H3G4_9PSEU|nr:LysR family transcriptional regulator [Lentzea flaviverrucosa]RDI34712.1 DNA-binding transcriptional LysR family regulator [Lentzea flaviverrucosa]SEQ56904.1 DNA-binding transcriptional regulator, LysR family [Lentzea flaviverrucosa]
MDVDTRLLRYFTAIAEEGNLTRAAQCLFVSQPALTKQLKHLESHLGVRLFTRSSTGMTLTGAGRALAARVPALLGAWDEAVAETRTAARVLRVGFLSSAANEATQDIVAAFRERRQGWRVDMRQAPWSDPTAGLAAAEVPVALLRLPFPGQESFGVRSLFREPRCAALSSTHPLAGRDEIAFAELLDEPVVAAPGGDGVWRDHWLAMSEREGREVRVGAVTEQPDEFLSAIAHGYGVALVPASAARFYARPGVVYRPVTGVSPSEAGVAWQPDADETVADFVRCCLALARAGAEV